MKITKNILRNILRKISFYLQGNLATKSDIENIYNQLFCIINIQNAMNGGYILKTMRGWAISPDAISQIIGEINLLTAPTVIEFGSGQSTVIFAALLKARGGKLISIEHDTDYSNVIKKQLVASGLQDVVNTIHSPLVDFGTFKSYDTKYILDISTPDIALVDGPPFFNGTMTRYHPLDWCMKNMKSGGFIYLDDSSRESERQCLEKLKHVYSGLFKLEELCAEKGLSKITII